MLQSFAVMAAKTPAAAKARPVNLPFTATPCVLPSPSVARGRVPPCVS